MSEYAFLTQEAPSCPRMVAVVAKFLSIFPLIKLEKLRKRASSDSALHTFAQLVQAKKTVSAVRILACLLSHSSDPRFKDSHRNINIQSMNKTNDYAA